jgi:hypothetical protein
MKSPGRVLEVRVLALRIPPCEFRRNPAGHTDLKPAAVPI